MNAKETLNLIAKQWCTLEDLQKISEFGETNTLKLRKKIKDKLEAEGYILPKNLLPMSEVVKYLKIDVQYLKERVADNEKNR